MKFGRLGAGFGRLGSNGKPAAGGSPPASPEVGNPIGLLLVLTYAS
jgi:hypothetical protein